MLRMAASGRTLAMEAFLMTSPSLVTSQPRAYASGEASGDGGQASSSTANMDLSHVPRARSVAALLGGSSAQGSGQSGQREKTFDAVASGWRTLAPWSSSRIELEMREYQYQVQLTPREEASRQLVSDRVQAACQEIFGAGATATVFGSSVNGTGTMKSDMDICLDLSQTQYSMSSKNASKKHLYSIMNFLHSSRLAKRGKTQPILHAKVPIIHFEDDASGLHVDLSLGNSLAICNTQLLRTYCEIDPRVRTLLYTLKLWASSRSINDASKSTMSSYALTIMLLSYLQQQVSPPVLPCLQQMVAAGVSERPVVIHSADYDVYFLSDMSEILSQFDASRNASSLRELLAGFFSFMAYSFRYNSNAINIRVGRTLPRKQCAANGNGSAPFVVEDPFEVTHNLTKGIGNVERIKLEFVRAAEIMSSNPECSLRDLCP